METNVHIKFNLVEVNWKLEHDKNNLERGNIIE